MALDENILDNISKKLELRRPNKEAVQAFLNYYYKSEKWFEYILSVATGVGKTYIIAAILNIHIYVYLFTNHLSLSSLVLLGENN